MTKRIRKKNIRNEIFRFEDNGIFQDLKELLDFIKEANIEFKKLIKIE